jgi:hypothetical protein
MKRAFLVLLFFLVLTCDRFPSNPPETPQNSKVVFVEHFSTDYVPASPPVEGLLATKVNVMFFEMRVENFKPKAIEFYGWALIDGPPEYQKRAIHFRTDSLVLNPEETGYTFNAMEWIEPGSSYVFIRPKFPTNEYSPFEGTQGMVKEVTITEVWAFDENGEKFSVSVGNSQ